MEELSWLEKYRPKEFKDYLSYNEYKDIVAEWIDPFLKKEQTARPFLVLFGPPAYGKTTLAHCILNEYDYEPLECNASDTRNKKQLEKYIKTGKTSFNMKRDGSGFRPYGLILDELDGLSCGDNGGVDAIMNTVFLNHSKIIKGNKYSVRYPVICTTNSIKEKKLIKILKFAHLINMKKPSFDALFELSRKIIRTEKIQITQKNFKLLINNDDDYRSVITKLNNIFLDLKNKSITKKKEYVNKIINKENVDSKINYIETYNKKFEDICNNVINNFEKYSKKAIINLIDNNVKFMYMMIICNYQNIKNNNDYIKNKAIILDYIYHLEKLNDYYTKNKNDNIDLLDYINYYLYGIFNIFKKYSIGRIISYKKYNEMKQNNSFFYNNINYKNKLNGEVKSKISKTIFNSNIILNKKDFNENNNIFDYMNNCDITNLLLKDYDNTSLGISDTFKKKIEFI